ncbi:MAG: putative oxidoreductase C-terminal domain-containing protein [Ginsengibacter sp.]
MSCNDNKTIETKKEVQLITLDPGHFHAALVQKYMYDDVDSIVYVYAPPGEDVQLHLDRINAYNKRTSESTNWKEVVYTGADFFDKMLAEKKDKLLGGEAGVVVLSGNNKRKTEYILKALQNGFNVLGDKPMAIDSSGFEELKQAFDVAAKNNLILYDIMTERFEITTILLRELSIMPEVFGKLENGTEDDPAVVKSSTHFLYKYVSGNILTRPGWFFDVSQEGEGIVDVMTHLVDLAQWECFPEKTIDYKRDILVNAAKHWTTNVDLSEFKEITKLDTFPSYLKRNIVDDSVLKMYCNGEINYQVKGAHIKTSVNWQYKAPEGKGDTYEATMKGTKATLVIKQGAEQQYKPILYIEPLENDSIYQYNLHEKFKIIQAKYPGVELQKSGNGWVAIIPDKYKEGHEEHFARVTKNFLEYIENKNMPAWEVPDMLAKYYTTTKGLELALKNKE